FADDGDLAVFLLHVLDQAGHVNEEFAIEMRAAGAVPTKQVVTRSRRGFGSSSGSDVLHRDMIDRDLDVVLIAPILCEFVEPFVIGRNEMTPLHDRKCFGVGQGARYKWCGNDWRRACGQKTESRLLQKPASCDVRKVGFVHLDSSPPPT